MMRCIPLIKCFSSYAITIICLAPILLRQPCIANQYLSEETVSCELPGQNMHGYFGCNAAAEPGLLCLPGNSTGKSIVFRGKKKERFFWEKKIKVLKLLILNVSMSFVFSWTIFGLLPWRLASLGISGCFFFFFFFPLLLLPPFLVVVRPYHFSLLVHKDVNSVAVWAWPGANTLLETC